MEPHIAQSFYCVGPANLTGLENAASIYPVCYDHYFAQYALRQMLRQRLAQQCLKNRRAHRHGPGPQWLAWTAWLALLLTPNQQGWQ